MLRGIDVSDWQPDIDWAAVRAGGYSFAMIKATQGTHNVQDTFTPYRASIPAAGMGPVGLYHFAQDGDPIAQAAHFCDVVGTLGPDEFAVLDIEGNEDFFSLPLAQWPGFINAWCEAVEYHLGPVAVYMSESPAKSMPASVGRWPLWVAGYQTRTPTEWQDWQVGPWSPCIWQHTSTASVPGVGGNCDANIAPDDLRSRLGLTVVPQPQPSIKELPMRFTYIADDEDFVYLTEEKFHGRLPFGDLLEALKGQKAVENWGKQSSEFHAGVSALAEQCGFAGSRD